MRILYVCQDAGIPVFGRKGASTHVRELIATLRRKGHEFHLICADLGPDAPEDLDLPHTVVRPATSKKLGADLRRVINNRRFARALPHVVATFKPDLIYERHSLYTGAALTLARRLRIPHLLEANALLSEEQAHRLHWPRWARRVEAKQFQGTDHLIVVSPGLRERCESLGAKPEAITINPIAVDPDRFAPRERDPALRASFGWSADDLVIGYLGAMTGWHRADLPLRALAKITKDHPRAKMLYIGGTPEHIEGIRALAERLKLTGITHFTGSLPHRDVPRHLADFDIGTLPGTHAWATPTKLFEYGAMGIARIAPDHPNIRAVVRDGESAALFEPESVESLATTLSKLLQDDDLRRTLGQNGRDEVLRHHTWVKHAECVENLFEKLRH